MGLSTTSVHRYVRQFVNAMLKHLSKFISMPSDEEAKSISEKFYKICKIPQILLIIDGTHIPVLAPKESAGDFVNRKGWTSYNVQIVADSDYIIRDVSCQYPGASQDAYVFKNSGLYENADKLLPKNPIMINGIEIDYLVLGDPAYPLLPWLIKGYSGATTDQEESFNAYMNSARIYVEQTIGKLKSRWRILKKVNEMDYRFIPKVILVCCILHNIAQKKKLRCPEDDECLTTGHHTFVQPPVRSMDNFFRSGPVTQQKQRGEAIRNTLRDITNKLPLRKQIVLNKK